VDWITPTFPGRSRKKMLANVSVFRAESKRDY
jgi:hypothetical protein